MRQEKTAPVQLPVGPPAPPGRALWPPGTPLVGRRTTVVPLMPEHAPALYKHLGGEENLWRWTHMPGAGFRTYDECAASIHAWSASQDPRYYVVLSPDSGDAAGLLSYVAITPQFRRLELGHIILGGVLQRSRHATEAFYLFLRHAFDGLGYTRVEWKANNLNAPSLAAAERLGFAFDGIFRKHMIIKGHFRDTAWFGMTDDDWPAVKRGFELWLDDSNFDDDGMQKRRLKECREAKE